MPRPARRLASRVLRSACGALLLLALSARGAHAAPPLRACADPDALPFSSEIDSRPGLYVELGRDIARALGRDLTTNWSVSLFGKRTVRTTLLAGACDFFIGLPGDAGFMGPRVIFSRPFAEIGYAIVTPKEHPLRALADMAGKRIAVLFGSPPQSLLAEHEDITGVTVMSAEAGMQALADGHADAAFIWGPNAGYLNRTVYAGRYDVRPVANQGMHWPVAIGFARDQTALRDAVDQALPGLRDAIAALSEKYGLPSGPPITLASLAPGTVLAAAESHAAADAAAVAQGRVIFNGTCAHCHGIDADTSERKRDLRRLVHRYGDQAHEVFIQTVTHGRPAKGMPNWRDVFSDDDFAKIYAYLDTLQQDTGSASAEQH